MENYTIEFLRSPGRDMHMHQDFELLFVLEGSVDVCLLDTTYHLHSDDVIVINSNNRHAWSVPVNDQQSRRDVLVCEVHFSYSMLREYFDQPLIYFVCNSSIENNRKYIRLREILGSLMNECALSRDRATPARTGLVYSLISYLSGNFMADRAIDTGQSDDLRINELLQYISTNHHRALSLDEMSSLLYISPSSFSRYFRKRTGMTFVKYLNNVRLHFAMEDLLYTDHPITVIAENHGFSNASAFCRAFGSQYRISPAKYRSLYKKQRREERSKELPAVGLPVPYTDKDSVSAEDDDEYGLIRITADIGRSEPLEMHWCDAVMLGDCGEILTSSYRRQISQARADLGFTYARVEHLFDNAMKLRHSHDSRVTNFDNLDEVFDFLVSENIRPIISLDNKPSSVVRQMDRLLDDYATGTTFLTMSECLGIVSDIMKHFVSRYGLREVREWLFDLWYDEYTDNVLGMKAGYPECFAEISRCIKKHAPGVMVGGCGLSPSINLAHFRKLLRKWSSGEVPPDFLSVYMYPFLRIDNIPAGQSALKKHSEFIGDEITNISRELSAVGWADMPVKVTEWNLSLIAGDPFNDSCGKAAILLACMTDPVNAVSLGAYDSLSDRSYSEHLSNLPLTGTRGLLTHDGICKPSYFAMQFISRLLPWVIERGPHYMITTDRADSYTILCFNEKGMHISYYRNLEAPGTHRDVHALFADDQSREFIFSLRGVTNGNYSIRQYCVSADSGSIQDTLDNMGGSHPEIDSEDIVYLRRITTPKLLHGSYEADSHRLIIAETLTAHEFRLIQITRIG